VAVMASAVAEAAQNSISVTSIIRDTGNRQPTGQTATNGEMLIISYCL
jgi:hypothetical protein